MKRPRLSTVLVTTAVVTLLSLTGPSVKPAGAAMPVFDAANVVQSTVTAVESVISVLNQAVAQAERVTHTANQVRQIAQLEQSLTNQVAQLRNDATNLSPSSLSLVSTLHSQIGQYADTLRNAQGLAFQASTLTTQFNQLYPTFGQPAMSTSALLAQTEQWLQQIRAASQTAMQVQAKTDDFVAHQARVTAAVSASERASGNLEVSQATNQLLGVMAEQTTSLQQIQASAARAQTSLIAAQAAAADRAQADANHLVEGLGTRGPCTGCATDFVPMHY